MRQFLCFDMSGRSGRGVRVAFISMDTNCQSRSKSSRRKLLGRDAFLSSRFHHRVETAQPYVSTGHEQLRDNSLWI